MIVTSGLHDSFSRIKKLAFAIRHARWNVGNFNKVHLINENSERPHTRGRYLTFITALPTAATRTGFVHVLYP